MVSVSLVMRILQLIGLFSSSVVCSSIIQGHAHVFYANVTTTPSNCSTTPSKNSASNNASANANASLNMTANMSFQNLTELNPFKSRAAAVQNLQFFRSALAGVEAPPILMSSDKSRPFSVQGDAFPDFATAGGRTCEIQYKGCCSAAKLKSGSEEPGPRGGKEGRNEKGQGKGSKEGGNNRARIRAVGNTTNNTNTTVPKGDAEADTTTRSNTNEKAGPNKPGKLSVAECEAQKIACNTAQRNAPFHTFDLENVGPDPDMPEFDLLCAP